MPLSASGKMSRASRAYVVFESSELSRESFNTQCGYFAEARHNTDAKPSVPMERDMGSSPGARRSHGVFQPSSRAGTDSLCTPRTISLRKA